MNTVPHFSTHSELCCGKWAAEEQGEVNRVMQIRGEVSFIKRLNYKVVKAENTLHEKLTNDVL